VRQFNWNELREEEGEPGEGAEGAGEGQTWGDNWRQDYAGEDATKLEHLGRYANPTAALDGLFAAQQKIVSGEYKQQTEYPSEGTPEAQATWREGNGVPKDAEGYGFGQDDGDAGLVGSLSATAFANNMSPGAAKVALDWHNAYNAELETSDAEQDAADKQNTDDALRAEWGNEFRGNMNKIHALLADGEAGLADEILGARLANGTMLGSDPAALRFLNALSLMKNPNTSIVPAGGDVKAALTDELATLQTLMADKAGEYWKGPKAEAHQERVREINTALATAR